MVAINVLPTGYCANGYDNLSRKMAHCNGADDAPTGSHNGEGRISRCIEEVRVVSYLQIPYLEIVEVYADAHKRQESRQHHRCKRWRGKYPEWQDRIFGKFTFPEHMQPSNNKKNINVRMFPPNNRGLTREELTVSDAGNLQVYGRNPTNPQLKLNKIRMVTPK